MGMGGELGFHQIVLVYQLNWGILLLLSQPLHVAYFPNLLILSCDVPSLHHQNCVLLLLMSR